MYNKLHDGPTHLPTGPRNYQPPQAKPRASLAAIQWAADLANQSYGTFTLNLTSDEETRIQIDYENYKREQAVAMAKRRAGHVDNAPPAPEGYIINDGDA